jgi:hypothetical protein
MRLEPEQGGVVEGLRLRPCMVESIESGALWRDRPDEP